MPPVPGLRRGARLEGLGALVVLAFAAVAALPWVVHIRDGDYSAGIVWAPLFGVLILTLAYQRGPVARVLSSRVAVYWGEASHALYMTHAIVLQVANKAVPDRVWTDNRVVRLGAIVVVLAAILAVAALTYRFVERPSRRWLRAARWDRLQRRPALR